MFMFTENGRVKFWSEGDKEGLILAETREVARKVCDWLGRTAGARATITELRAVLQAAFDCGMVPITSAKEGGAARFSEQVRVADRMRAALEKDGE